MLRLNLFDPFSRSPWARPSRRTTADSMARIEAAEQKRAVRALIADRNAYRSWCGNPCLSGSNRHNPTFVNRSE